METHCYTCVCVCVCVCVSCVYVRGQSVGDEAKEVMCMCNQIAGGKVYLDGIY